jgi:purine-binding chemotaxis protein CheW
MTATAELLAQEQQMVVFFLAGERYGIDIALINEIIRQSEITCIPRTPMEIEGVINLRGKIVPIMNLRRRMGLPPTENTSSTRIIVVALDDQIVGIIVDRVEGVVRIPESQIEPPSQLITRRDQEYVRGVGKAGEQMIILQ